MGLLYPKPYKVLRNGKWIVVTPKPIDYSELKDKPRGGKKRNNEKH